MLRTPRKTSFSTSLTIGAPRSDSHRPLVNGGRNVLFACGALGDQENIFALTEFHRLVFIATYSTLLNIEQTSGANRSIQQDHSISEADMHLHHFICWLITLTIWGAGNPSQSFGHDVGEPALQNLPIWNQCCGDGDCVPENVQILGKPSNKQLDVEIHGVETYVDKDKFSPVPSNRTWVCYMSPGGAIRNENIRCILHPQSGGTN